MSEDVVLIGCGDLGSRIARGLLARGLTVCAVRRRVELLPDGVRPVRADLTDTATPLPPLRAAALVIALTADVRDTEGYRRTYVHGMLRALDALAELPQRAVLISSTGALDPVRPTAAALREAEDAFRSRVPHGVVARASGLYGTLPSRLVDQARRGENPDPGRWTNRIHRDDAAAAVCWLVTGADAPRDCILTDDEPATAGTVRAFVAGLLGRTWAEDTATPHGRRLDNHVLRDLGFDLRYPTYREGFRALLGSEAPRPDDAGSEDARQ